MKTLQTIILVFLATMMAMVLMAGCEEEPLTITNSTFGDIDSNKAIKIVGGNDFVYDRDEKGLKEVGGLKKVEIEVVDPNRKDLTIKGKVGVIIRHQFGEAEPMAFRCFESDPHQIAKLIEDCTYFDPDNWCYMFVDNASYRLLVSRGLISEDEYGSYFSLGIGMTLGGKRFLSK